MLSAAQPEGMYLQRCNINAPESWRRNDISVLNMVLPKNGYTTRCYGSLTQSYSISTFKICNKRESATNSNSNICCAVYDYVPTSRFSKRSDLRSHQRTRTAKLDPGLETKEIGHHRCPSKECFCCQRHPWKNSMVGIPGWL